ncbi:hypothetical protein MSG28_010393 [Choristoneura fumiferana]|uniref:Uncharacterized protein n=1 Tax=Choristoneura fumiferana TaxID=7141 RepID=A0ACC0KK76_CHOFU|nr:hypothetical protein MSG28_010393 [Choristoneura fumiferana]
MSEMGDSAPIIKTTIYAGQKYKQILEGSKERVLIDDSRKIGQKEPMVLVIGHKFKLEVWESIVKMMAVGEVASFRVKQKLVFSYPFVSKTLRELGQDHGKRKHACSMTLHTEGMGYPDLDDLTKNPCDLEFIIELLRVERSDEYEKDVWQLTTEERLNLIPTLKEKGNKMYAQKRYDEAEEDYSQAIAICEQLMVRERKLDEEWTNLNKIKLPILLNYAQCKLIKGEYYAVIEHCNTVLEHDKDNEKALYRRAKAHVGAWNPNQAEEDLNRLKALNPAMAAAVDKEIANIKKLIKEKESKDKGALKKMFENENGKTDITTEN